MAYEQPGPARRMRASDQDRQEAIRALGDHHAEGRLDLAEFTGRMEQAQVATYLDQLDPLFVDLPRRAADRGQRGSTPPGRMFRPQRVLPVLMVLALAASIALAASFHFFPFWLLLGLWFVWAQGARRHHRQWRYQPALAQRAVEPSRRPW
jgi:hypothetical protein